MDLAFNSQVEPIDAGADVYQLVRDGAVEGCGLLHLHGLALAGSAGDGTARQRRQLSGTAGAEADGLEPPIGLVNSVAAIVFLGSIAMSVGLNVRDWRRAKRVGTTNLLGSA